jgi:hypothetical protein
MWFQGFRRKPLVTDRVEEGDARDENKLVSAKPTEEAASHASRRSPTSKRMRRLVNRIDPTPEVPISFPQSL